MRIENLAYMNLHEAPIFISVSPSVPLMEKPGSWFLQAICVENTCGRVKFKVKMQVKLQKATNQGIKKSTPKLYKILQMTLVSPIRF